jgi:hypothetical protein
MNIYSYIKLKAWRRQAAATLAYRLGDRYKPRLSGGPDRKGHAAFTQKLRPDVYLSGQMTHLEPPLIDGADY